MTLYHQLQTQESTDQGGDNVTVRTSAALVRHTSQLAKESLCREDSAVANPRDYEVSQVKLKRNLTLVGGVSLVIGAIIGSGLFMLPNLIFIETGGSPLLSLLVWLVGGLIAFCGSICYAELATSITVSGGEQAYLTKMYGPLMGFLFVWTNTLVLNPGGLAAISLYCAEFIVVNIQQGYSKTTEELEHELNNQSEYFKGGFAILIIGVASVFNALSTELGDKINQAFAVIKVTAIGVICCIGIYWIHQGEYGQLSEPFITNKTTFSSTVNALTLSMWAYGGWSFLSWVAEEIIDPSRNIPLALFIGIFIVVAVYLLFNLAIFLGPALNHAPGSSPFVLLYARTAWSGWGWFCASFCIISATYGAVSSNTISTTRFYHACARDGHLPRSLSLCLPSRSTPIVAIIFNFLLTVVYIMVGKHADQVVEKVMYTQWVYFVFVFIGLIILRFTRPNMRRPYKAPFVIPVFLTFASILMILSPVLDTDKDDDYVLNIVSKYGIALGSIVTGIPFYLLCIYQKTRLAIFERVSEKMTELCKKIGFQ